MKKHPIDSLFAQKLKETEIKPREEAWDKLQNRMQQKKKHRIGGWWQQSPWLAAAGVCLLLVAGWLMWRSTASNDTELAQHSVIPNSKKQTIEKVPKQQPKIVIEEEPKEQIAAVEHKSQVAEEPVHKNAGNTMPELRNSVALPQPMVAKVNEGQKADNQAISNQSIKESVPTPIDQDIRSVAQVNAPASGKSSTKTVVLQLPEIKETLVAANVENNGVESEMKSKENTEGADDFEDNLLTKPRKSTRMAKVWKQLKNAKNGERVDWDEVGFNPNKMLAKATGKEKERTN
jgi:hypothetical protein